MMHRRAFLKSLVGGVATAAAVRTCPFRVFSFPTQPVITGMRGSCGVFPPDNLGTRNLIKFLEMPKIPPEVFQHLDLRRFVEMETMAFHSATFRVRVNRVEIRRMFTE